MLKAAGSVSRRVVESVWSASGERACEAASAESVRGEWQRRAKVRSEHVDVAQEGQTESKHASLMTL